MSRVPFNPGPFSNVNVYDSPGVLFSTIMDGEFTSDGALASFFDPSKLSPMERDTTMERLKKAAGNNRVVSSLIDVALNPWVWMFAVTSPAGTSALANGAKSIFTSKAKYLATIAEHPSVWQALGSSSPMQTLQGTSAAAVGAQANATYRKFLVDTAGTYEEIMGKFLKAHDLPHLDPAKILNQEKKLKADYYGRLLHHSLEGLDQERELTTTAVRTLYHIRDETGAPKRVSKRMWEKADAAVQLTPTIQQGEKVTKVGPYIINGALEQEIQRIPGLADVRDSMREALTKEYRLLFGKDGNPLEVDPKKLATMYDFLRNPLFNGGATKDMATGLDMAHKLMGPEMAGLMEQGVLTQDAFVGMMTKVAEKAISGKHYFPRNVTETYMPSGQVLDFESFLEQKSAGLFKMPVQAISRIRAREFMHPDDYEWIAKNFAGDTSEELTKAHTVATESLKRAQTTGDAITFQRVRVPEALAKHFHSSAETYAWALTAPNDEVRAAMKMMLEERVKAGGTHVTEGFENLRRNVVNPGAPKVRIDEDWTSLGEDRLPWGGVNLADAAFQTHGLMPGKYQRDTLVHLVIPGSTGRVRTTHLLSKASIIAGKQATESFANSRLGSAIEEHGGDFGKRMIQQMKDFAVSDSEYALNSTGRKLTSLLYASHLGANLQSAVLNASQPWLLGANWLGAGNVAKGYVKAFKEIADYTADRAKTFGLLKAISPEDQAMLIRRNFKWANLDGEDFLGITHGAEEAIDALSFSPTQGRASKIRSNLFEMVMTPFQKVEWLNRSVIAHAAEAAHEAKGTALGIVKGDVRRAVAETQFGMDFLNTPAAFQTDNPNLAKLGGLGTIPFARQFIHYPIRSLTGLLNVAPSIARGERTFGFTGLKTSNRYGVIAHDVMRGMAISAVGYELAKNMLHADISRGLFAASTTQLPASFVEGKGGVLPAPPAIDIVRSFGKFLTDGDLDILRQTVPRLVPGGIALSKAMGMAPQMPTWASVLTGQKTYADWKNVTPDGRVPIYKSDGTLIEYQPSSLLFMKGVGLDLGAGLEAGQVDKMLVNNAEEIRNYRQQYISKLIGGDPLGADSVARVMEKRFGIPLTVTKSQVAAAMKLRTTPRSERMIDRLPSEVRPQYLKMMAETPSRFNVAADVLANTTNGKMRDPSRVGVPQLDPQTKAEIERRMKAMNPLSKSESSQSAFPTFGDFST